MADDYSQSFKVETFLGRGGFGSVHLVTSREDKKQYALKVILPDANGNFAVGDIWKELRVMSEMEHRNIIKVYKAHQAVDMQGLVKSIAIQIQFCPNGDLGKYLAKREGRKLTCKRLTTWMADLASAVEYMHSRNVLHRDLKPDNILLTASDILKISDFGIARFVKGCQASTIIGTPFFLAPEVLTGQGYNEKADIFSLGRVFFCMATVSPLPFDLSAISISYPDELYHLIRRCLFDNPGRRPSAKIVYKEAMEMADKA